MTLFKKILGHLDLLIKVIPNVFEVYKPNFKSERLQRLCTLKSITEDDEEKETSATTKQNSAGHSIDEKITDEQKQK